MTVQLKYNRDAVKLLRHLPAFSISAADLLRKREEQLRIKFPAAVVEWYSLENAVQILASHSNSDSLIEIEEFGKPFQNWYGGGPKDFLAEQLLLFMQENQGVCNWAIRLDDDADPSVVVEVDTAPNAKWIRCADHFSTFVWCQIWDHSPLAVSVSSQEIELVDRDVCYLQANFQQLHTTYGWPGRVNYRFESAKASILIWDGKDRGVDWFLSAPTAPDLKELLAKIWHCGNLAKSMYGDGEANEVLRQMRNNNE